MNIDTINSSRASLAGRGVFGGGFPATVWLANFRWPVGPGSGARNLPRAEWGMRRLRRAQSSRSVEACGIGKRGGREVAKEVQVSSVQFQGPGGF